MKKMNLNDLKECEFNILCYIDGICRKHGLKYSLIGGTLLGAVRHGGFIPWDDDIDIAMPRPDYEKFIEYAKIDNIRYKVITNKTEKNWKDIYAKVIDTNTVIREYLANRFEYENGVFVDLFPVDVLADTFEDSVKLFRKSSFNREMLNAVKWKRYTKSKTRFWGYEFIRFPFFVISRFVNPDKLIRKIESLYLGKAFDSAKFVVVLAGVYREKEIVPYEVYRDYIDLKFEGKTFMCIKQYNVWLSKVYGDYMKLPPKEKQITHHSFDAFYIDE